MRTRFVEFQRVPGIGGDLPDAAPVEHLLRSTDGGNGVRPAGVEGEVGNDLADLVRCHAVVERPADMPQGNRVKECVTTG